MGAPLPPSTQVGGGYSVQNIGICSIDARFFAPSGTSNWKFQSTFQLQKKRRLVDLFSCTNDDWEGCSAYYEQLFATFSRTWFAMELSLSLCEARGSLSMHFLKLRYLLSRFSVQNIIMIPNVFDLNVTYSWQQSMLLVLALRFELFRRKLTFETMSHITYEHASSLWCSDLIFEWNLCVAGEWWQQ